MRELLRMTTREYDPGALFFWPVGTVEAHDRGPLGTDVIAPEKLARDLSGEFDAVLLPTLPFGLVNTLAGWPGCMWMSPGTYRALVSELLGSLSRSGARGVIVFNGHGGNTRTLLEVLPEIWREHGTRCALVDWWVAGGDIAREVFGGSAGHGGSDELALVHAADPAFLPVWDGRSSWRDTAGMKPFPVPASSMRYDDDPPVPFSAEGAAEYYGRLRERIASLLRSLLDGWEAG